MSVDTIHADILEEFLKLLKNHIPDHVISKIEEELKKEQ